MQLVVVLMLLASSSGCVQRRFLVRSQPEGALVTIDHQSIGLTPVSVPFTYYGTREIQLEKDGYKTVKVKQRFRPTLVRDFSGQLYLRKFLAARIA